MFFNSSVRLAHPTVQIRDKVLIIVVNPAVARLFSPDCSGSLVGCGAYSTLHRSDRSDVGTLLCLGAVRRRLPTTSAKQVSAASVPKPSQFIPQPL